MSWPLAVCLPIRPSTSAWISWDRRSRPSRPNSRAFRSSAAAGPKAAFASEKGTSSSSSSSVESSSARPPCKCASSVAGRDPRTTFSVASPEVTWRDLVVIRLDQKLARGRALAGTLTHAQRCGPRLINLSVRQAEGQRKPGHQTGSGDARNEGQDGQTGGIPKGAGHQWQHERHRVLEGEG